jgi:hypothetical protein
MGTTTQPVAGWYRDPSERYEHRWWNGSEWTPHVMTLGLRSIDYGGDGPASSPHEHEAGRDAEPTTDDADGDVPAGDPAADPPRWPPVICGTVLLGAALLAIGAVLPWAEASAASASFSSSGIDGNGGAALVAALGLALLCTLTRRTKSVAAAMIGIAVIVGAIALHDARDIADRADELMRRLPNASAGVGVGVWVALAGAVVALVGGLIAFLVATRSGAHRAQVGQSNGQTEEVHRR